MNDQWKKIFRRSSFIIPRSSFLLEWHRSRNANQKGLVNSPLIHPGGPNRFKPRIRPGLSTHPATHRTSRQTPVNAGSPAILRNRQGLSRQRFFHICPNVPKCYMVFGHVSKLPICVVHSLVSRDALSESMIPGIRSPLRRCLFWRPPRVATAQRPASGRHPGRALRGTR